MLEDKVKEILSELLALIPYKAVYLFFFFFKFILSEWPEAFILAIQWYFYRGYHGEVKMFILFQKHRVIA